MTFPFSHIAKGKTLLIAQTMQQCVHLHNTSCPGRYYIISN